MSIRFDRGSPSRVDFGNWNVSDVTTGLTAFVYWTPVNYDGSFGGDLFHKSQGSNNSASDWLIGPASAYRVVGRLRAGGSTSQVLATLPQEAFNAPMFMAIIYDNTKVDMWVNGSIVATVSKTGNLDSRTSIVTIGGDQVSNAVDAITGNVHHARVYNRALSIEELNTIMYSNCQDNIVDRLEAKYHLDEQPGNTIVPATGDEVLDHSPFRRHGNGYKPSSTSYPFWHPSPYYANRRTAYSMTAENLLATLGDQINVVAYGRNDWGQARGNNDQVSPRPNAAIIDSRVGIAGFFNAYHHSLIWFDNGDLYGFGSNTYGEARGDGQTSDAKPISDLIDTDVKKAVGGMNTTFVLKNNGDLYGFGRNDYLQARGSGLAGDSAINSELIYSGVKDVSAGDHTVLLLDDGNGTVVTFGLNNSSQCVEGGSGPSNSPFNTLTTGVSKVAAGRYHTVLLRDDGSVWAMGRNDHGQCRGDGGNDDEQTTLFQMVASGAKDVRCHKDGTVILMDNGDVLACGQNDHGQCRGDGTTSAFQGTLFLMATGVEEVGTAYYGTFLRYPDNHLWGCGLNSTGQVLGNGDLTDPIATLTSINTDCNGLAGSTLGIHAMFSIPPAVSTTS